MLAAGYLSLAFCVILRFCRYDISLAVTAFSEIKAVTLLFHMFYLVYIY
jgi:hypothetical protein